MLASLGDDRRIQTPLIAGFFGLFMEGAARFGTPVALAAPLLAGLGRPPVRAVALALLGHAAGVSYGPRHPGAGAGRDPGAAPGATAAPTAALHALTGPIPLLAMTRLAGGDPLARDDVGWAGSRRSHS